MTTNEFMKAVKDYYLDEGGSYRNWPEMQRGLVQQWIEKRGDRSRGLIFAELVKTFSTRWKIPPGVAELEEAWKIVRRDRLDTCNDDGMRPMIPSSTEPIAENEEAMALFDELKAELAAKKRMR